MIKYLKGSAFSLLIAAAVILIGPDGWAATPIPSADSGMTAGGEAATNPATALPPERLKAWATTQWVQNWTQDWPFLQHRLMGNELWKYIFSFAYVFLAFYASKFLDYATRGWLKKWVEKTETQLDNLLLTVLNGPIKIISFVIFLRIGLDIFDWPPGAYNILTKCFTVVVAVTITYTSMKLVDLLMSYWQLKSAPDSDREFREQIFPIIRKTLKAFVVVVAALVTLSNVGIDITAVIASLSIGGLAVGLAAQDTLANLFGAVAILLDKPFRIGDQITVDGLTGVVETIGLRSTRIRNLDGHLVTIPNKTIGNATLTNVTSRANIKTTMNIGITYDTPAEKVRQALALLEEIYKGHPKTADLLISFNKFGDSALNLQVVHWWGATDMKAYLAGMQEINLAIKDRFDAEGISFAFPTQTVYLKQDSIPGRSGPGA